MPAIKEFYLDPRNGQANFEYEDGTTKVVGLDQATGSVSGSSSYNILPYLTKGHIEGPGGGSTFQLLATGAAGQSWQIQTCLECDFDAVQIGVFNSDTVAVAGVSVTLLSPAALQADSNVASNYNAAQWTDATFAGATTGTLAANTSGAVGQPSITWSDIMQMPSTARTDAGKTLPILSVRVGYPTGVNFTYMSGPGATGSAWETDSAAVGNRPFRVRLQAVSAASNATKAALTASTMQTSFWPPVLIRYWPRAGGCRQLDLVGDSELSNIGATVARYGWAQMYQAAVSTPAKPIEIVGMSLGGSIYSQIYTAAKCIAPIFPGATVIYPNGTINDTTGTLFASNISAWRWYKAQMRALFSSYKQVAMTIMPVNFAVKAWGATDSLRRDMNTVDVESSDITVFNASAAISGGIDANGQEVMANTTDGAHPNNDGHVVLSSALATRLPI